MLFKSFHDEIEKLGWHQKLAGLFGKTVKSAPEIWEEAIRLADSGQTVRALKAIGGHGETHARLAKIVGELSPTDYRLITSAPLPTRFPAGLWERGRLGAYVRKNPGIGPEVKGVLTNPSYRKWPGS